MASRIAPAAPSGRPVRVELYADLVCPWCFIASRRLEHVAAADRGTAITYRTYLVQPDTPPYGVDFYEHMRKRYGVDPSDMVARAEAEARDTGIPLELAKRRVRYPTTRAHTLLRRAIPLGTQRALANALFEAYFLEGRNIGDPAVLVPIAAAHGIPAEEATRLIEDVDELALTRRDADDSVRRGITCAPHLIVDGDLAFSGAQPESVLREALAQARARHEVHA